jgi:acyl transferase domain-containing protein
VDIILRIISFTPRVERYAHPLLFDPMVEPIAVIGTGCRFPGGADTPSKLWSVIHEPRDLSRKPSDSRFNIDAFYHPVGTHHGTTNATKSYWLEDDERSNVTQFDAGFFSIQSAEADAMDPQQRLLMHVVYDSLCAAGLPMEKLRGSDTAVYVGSMCDDYNTMLTRDWETLPRYTATGLERGILANRVSYFFDWHGPSLSLDTACSSSLVALDHAVQTIRSGRSRMAVAAGTSLILSPGKFPARSASTSLGKRNLVLTTSPNSYVHIREQSWHAISKWTMCYVGYCRGRLCSRRGSCCRHSEAALPSACR